MKWRQLQLFPYCTRGPRRQAGPEVVHSFLVCHPQCVDPLPWACFLLVPKWLPELRAPKATQGRQQMWVTRTPSQPSPKPPWSELSPKPIASQGDVSLLGLGQPWVTTGAGGEAQPLYQLQPEQNVGARRKERK